MHEMLTNQILLFHFEPGNTLDSVRLRTTTGAVLGLQIKQAVNDVYSLDPLSGLVRDGLVC